MKLVYGDHVVENASVVIEPRRLSPHDEPGRIIKLIELTVPADASNGGYAVRQLLGQDPDICAKSVVTLEVALTQQQISRLEKITEDELRDIRNGVNPAMIFGVRVYDSEPMGVEEFITGKKWPRWFTPSQNMKDATGTEIICFRRDSEHSGETFCIGGRSYRWHEWKGEDLQLEEITEQEAQAIIAHSVKPTGETVSQWPKFFVHDGTVYPDMWLLEQTTEGWGFAYFHNRPKVLWRFSSKTETPYYRQISHAEAMEISADVAVGKTSTVNVNPTGEYPACVQWFQHNVQEVIVRRDSHDRATYFERDLPPAENVLWDDHYSQYVESGYWKEITEQEAVRRIEENRKVPRCRLECENHDCILKAKLEDLDSPFVSIPCRGCGTEKSEYPKYRRPEGKRSIECMQDVVCVRYDTEESGQLYYRTGLNRPFYNWGDYRELGLEEITVEQFKEIIASIDSMKPIPRNIPNLAFVGIDWGKRSDIGATQQVNTLPFSLGDGPLQLQLRNDFDQEGIWLYVVAGDLRLALVTQEGIDAGKYSFPISCPCIHLCSYPRVKWPVEYRNAAMPKDYGKEVMYFGDFGPEWGRGILRGLRSTGTGREDLIVEIPTETMNGLRTETIDSRRVFVIDAPTEGF